MGGPAHPHWWDKDFRRCYELAREAGLHAVDGFFDSANPNLEILRDLGILDNVDEVIAGCGTQVGNQSACIARMSALDAGWSIEAPGVSIDRFCGSGQQHFFTVQILPAKRFDNGFSPVVLGNDIAFQAEFKQPL